MQRAWPDPRTQEECMTRSRPPAALLVAWRGIGDRLGRRLTDCLAQLATVY